MLQNESSDIGCKDLYNATSASINLTETFRQCCNEAEECVLPKQFYNVSCREQIIASCAKNGSQINLTTFALSQIKSKCCRNVTFSENNFTTPRNNRGSKCFKINVTWGRVKFSAKHDQWGMEERKLVIFPELSGVANVLKPINLQKAARYAFVYVPLLHWR